MEFTYGEGVYCEGDKRIEGQIVLSEHKLYMKGPEGEYAQSFVPLEKIEGIKRSADQAVIHVRPSLAYRYDVTLQGKKKHILDLIKDIVQRRGMKKKFLKNEWVEVVH